MKLWKQKQNSGEKSDETIILKKMQSLNFKNPLFLFQLFLLLNTIL